MQSLGIHVPFVFCKQHKAATILKAQKISFNLEADRVQSTVSEQNKASSTKI